MKFIEPSENYTIYTKSNCNYCKMVKDLLNKHNVVYEIVDCDEYLLHHRLAFLFFIKERAKFDYNTFPIVFLNGKFIGGFTETEQLLENDFFFV